MKLAADDYVAIQNLYSLYNLSSDEADAVTYSQCFTRSGTLEIGTIGLKVQGRDQLLAYKQKDKAARKGTLRRHWNNNIHVVMQDDGSARGRCYILAFNASPEQLPAIADCGTYEDDIRKEDGEWRFHHRRLTLEATTFSVSALALDKP